jgi:hypothetical protein
MCVYDTYCLSVFDYVTHCFCCVCLIMTCTVHLCVYFMYCFSCVFDYVTHCFCCVCLIMICTVHMGVFMSCTGHLCVSFNVV